VKTAQKKYLKEETVPVYSRRDNCNTNHRHKWQGLKIVRQYPMALPSLHLTPKQIFHSRATVPTKVLLLQCQHIGT